LEGKLINRIDTNILSGFKVIDSRNWKPGIYSIIVGNNESDLEVIKVIKIK